MSWWRSHSVRLSLTFWNVTAMIVVIAVYAAGVFVFVSDNASRALDNDIRGDSQWATAMADTGPNGALKWFDDPLNFGADSPWLQVWCSDPSGCGPGQNTGDIVFRTLKATRNPIPGTERLVAHANDRVTSIPTKEATYRVLTTPATISVTDPQTRADVVNQVRTTKHVVIQVARSETQMRQYLSGLLAILALGLPIGVAAAGAFGYWLARRALAPVETMAERAQLIEATNLHDRLPVTNPNNELGRLAVVFNETLSRLETAFEQMRRFTGDVSHELRTPLTAIRSVGEVGLRERRDEQAYRGIIASMLEEVDRLATLVDRLLTWSRAETGQARMALEVINLQVLAEEVSAHLGVLAEEKGQSLIIEQVGSPRALADRLVLRQSLINLVDNAIKYTPRAGQIRIRVSESATAAIIDVADSGPGIPAELKARIFDRFNRSDRRSGDIGGTGLGLSISKAAIEMNGGRLTLESTSAAGSTFRISLPRATAGHTKDSRRKSVA
jgi:heavy metal sensor kinase